MPGRSPFAGQLKFDAELFDEATIARMAGHYRQLLEAFVREPEAAISAPSLLTEGEVRWLAEANATAAEQPSQVFARLFEERAATQPGAPAVSWSGAPCSATASSTRGPTGWRATCGALASARERWWVCACTRSPELLVGAPRVLKAGGAYVPLDPAFPPSGSAFMLADAAPRGAGDAGGAARALLRRRRARWWTCDAASRDGVARAAGRALAGADRRGPTTSPT